MICPLYKAALLSRIDDVSKGNFVVDKGDIECDGEECAFWGYNGEHSQHCAIYYLGYIQSLHHDIHSFCQDHPATVAKDIKGILGNLKRRLDKLDL